MKSWNRLGGSSLEEKIAASLKMEFLLFLLGERFLPGSLGRTSLPLSREVLFGWGMCQDL